MTLANPLALLWGLLAVPIVILYLRRIRLRRAPVATDMFWEQVFAAERVREAWQRWRHPVSLAVQLIVLALVVVALADPQLPGPRRIVLVIDNSASMKAADVEPSRLDRAKQAAGRIVAGLRPCDCAAVLTAGSAVDLRCGLTNDQAALQDVLEKVKLPAAGGLTEMGAAVALARRTLEDYPGGEIVVLTDGCFEGTKELVAADDVEIIRVGKRTPNVAITRLAARRNIKNRSTCQVLAEVRNFSDSDQPVECRLEAKLDGKPLEIKLNGKPVNTVPIKLAKDERRPWVFEITAAGAGRLTARLDHSDPYPDDNQEATRVPPAGDVQSAAVPEVELLAEERARVRESDLRAPGHLRTEAALAAADRARPPIRLYLVGVGLLLLALEWCFYQRRWIH